MFRTLLISFVNWDSLMELPGILKNGGCTVDIFCIKDSWALQNESYDKWIEASIDEASFVKELLTYIEKNGANYQWIIPGDDIIIRILNEQPLSEALFYKIMPLTKIENRQLLGSKAGFSELCNKYSIKTPKYLIYNETMTSDSIGDYMGFPFLMKVDKSESGYGVFMCENKKDITTHLANIKNKQNLVFQQFIKGYDVNVEVLYRHNELLVYSYSRTLTIMGKFGVSTQRLFYQNPEIEPVLRKMGKDFGLSGFGNVVFMYSETENTHYLIETDVRPNAWMYYGKFMGNDFSEGIKRMIKGDLHVVQPTESQAKQILKISLYKKDMYRCINEKDIKGLMAWITNKDNCRQYIPKYDRKLLAACDKYLWDSFKELAVGKIKKTVGLKNK